VAGSGLAESAVEVARARGGRLALITMTGRPDVITVAGKPSDTLHAKTWASIIREAGLEDER
jgi:predicted RNA binding protein YcfA (HicA-like mRNA interferase family)